MTEEDLLMHTAPGIRSFGSTSESVFRNKFLDSPILQDERQVESGTH